MTVRHLSQEDVLVAANLVQRATQRITGQTISAVSDEDPSEITTAAAHGLTTGDSVRIWGSDVVAANAVWEVTVVDETHFTIPLDNSGGAAGVAGWWEKTTRQTFPSVVPEITVHSSHDIYIGKTEAAVAAAAANGAADTGRLIVKANTLTTYPWSDVNVWFRNRVTDEVPTVHVFAVQRVV